MDWCAVRGARRLERRERNGSSGVSRRPSGSRAAAVGSASHSGVTAAGEGGAVGAPLSFSREHGGGRGGSADNSVDPALLGPRLALRTSRRPVSVRPDVGGGMTTLTLP